MPLALTSVRFRG